VSVARLPRVSVIVPTYNWSSALGVALESIRDQTFGDYEVLVSGDACTDDSEAVVRAIGDARFAWSNLSQNCGSQWGPNNHALGLARGEFIAYLGHDDLWWPTHLETGLAAFDRTGADIVAAAALLYGPPESGVRAVTGFFPHGVYAPRHFFPPSSMLHRRELAQRVGGWRAPEQANISVDHDFLIRCHAAGARIVATEEVTAFKFNAAWRRDAYRRRDASEQRAHLAAMRKDGEAFRRRELSATLRAASEDRLQRIENPPDGHYSAAPVAVPLHTFKGSLPRRTASEPLAQGRTRFERDDSFAGFEWHALEMHPAFGGFRWSGPSTRSTIMLPVRVERALEITVQILGWITPETLPNARLSANGAAIEARIAPGSAGDVYWTGQLDPASLPAADREEIRLTIEVDKTHRPLDRGISEDRRWTGLAVGWIEIAAIR
jgi:glycosyltransferase involved in cell wall biosynthesis